MADARTYAAFISYSHATDHELGPSLQEGIEKFAKPWYRARARRVFLDNSVLAAESDLTGAILDGLGRAEHFLLLASPASARSRWVAKEVAWWLENRDRRSLFVVLTDGEAVWDNGVLDTARTTALPEALHGIPEPRCVDLRGLRDVELDARNPQWESVLADVVAPLDGVEKPELIGHHIRERRRTRRTVTVTISVLVVLLVASVIFAVRSGQQSDRAQQQTLVATSRQLVAQATAIRDSRPGIARQLLAQAYRMSPTAEVLGALVESPSIPRVVPTGENVGALSAAASGEVVAAIREKEIVVYDGTTERKSIPLGVPGFDVALHPDGKHVVVSTDDTVQVIDIADPARRYVRQGGAGSLAFARDKPVLVADRVLLDLAEPLAPREIGVLSATGTGPVAISADGTTVALSRAGDVVELWDVSAVPIRRRTFATRSEQVLGLRFASRGSVLAVTAGEAVQLWNTATGELYSVLTGADQRVRSLAFSPDGTMLAVGDVVGRISLWDIADAVRPRATPALTGHIGAVAALAFRADSRVLVSASRDGAPDQPVLRFWNVLAAARSSALSVLPVGGNELAFGAHRQLATGWPTVVYDLVDPANPRTVRTLRTFNVVRQPVAFSPDGARLAMGLPIVLVDPGTDATPAVKQVDRAERVVFSPDGRLVGVTSAGDGATLWERRGDEAERTAVLPGTGFARNGIAFSPDSRRVVAAGPTGESVLLWDVGDPRRPQQVLAIDTKDDPVDAVLFGPGDDVVVAGTKSGAIAVWRVDGTPVARVGAHLGSVQHLVLHPDGHTLASADTSGEVTIWEFADPARPLGVTLLSSGRLYDAAAIAFSPDGALLGAADGTRTTVWSIDSPRLLAKLCADSPAIPETVWRQYLPDVPYDPPCA
ncbi:hypothetical protein [Lentzea sp. NPDC060358]|uniref:hypothetical protein n=1 Tax=Lentzea sp. NPDC060358 TaxID=3347103 RepID=UPI003659187E